jgi:hypothetical protein
MTERQPFENVAPEDLIPIPQMIGFDSGLTEPVCCNFSLRLRENNPKNIKYIDALISELRDLHYKIFRDSSEPDTISIRDTDDGFDVVTPFYSANNAKNEIEKIVRVCNSSPGLIVTGVLTPVSFDQLYPFRPEHDEFVEKMKKLKDLVAGSDSFTTDQKDRILPFINHDFFRMRDQVLEHYLIQAIRNKDSIFGQTGLIENLNRQNYDDKVNLLFRGQQFANRSDASAYSVVSDRRGRLGYPYGTNDPKYAVRYAFVSGDNENKQVPQNRTIQINGKDCDIGFLNVYHASPDNKIFRNFGAEDSMANQAMAASWADRHSETILSQTTNPIKDRYLIVKSRQGLAGTFIRCKKNDEIMNLILDSYAPLNIETLQLIEYPRAYMCNFYERLKNLYKEKQSNGGTVKTYDSLPDKGRKFSASKDALANRITPVDLSQKKPDPSH